jgi:hypothetical protein
MRDGLSSIQVKTGYGAYYYQGNTAWQTAAIDTVGYDSLTFLVAVGAVLDADTVVTILMQESDDGTTYTDVADADMVTQTDGTAPETAAGFQFDDDGEVRKIGYIGSKRYAKLYATSATNTGVTNLAIVAVQGHPGPANSPITQGAS